MKRGWPNLGPFVVAASVWEVPSPPGGFDFWTAIDAVLTNAPRANEERLPVADSKRVFVPGSGFAAPGASLAAIDLLGLSGLNYKAFPWSWLARLLSVGSSERREWQRIEPVFHTSLPHPRWLAILIQSGARA